MELTLEIEAELVEGDAGGLVTYKAVHVLLAALMMCDRVVERLRRALNCERRLRLAHREAAVR